MNMSYWVTSMNIDGSDLKNPRELQREILNKLAHYKSTGEYKRSDDVLDSWRHSFGHYNARCSFTTNETKRKEDDKMLKIKKTDEMTIEEFKENLKPYDIIKLIIDKEKFDKFKEDYGKEPFNVSGVDEYYVDISGGIIEFKNKGIKFTGSWHNQVVPYSFITKVIGVYYLTNGSD